MRQGGDLTGSHTCGFIVADSPEVTCGKPSVGHFMWNDDGDNGTACVDHTPWAMARAVDWHTLVDDCTMPGVVWVFSRDGLCGRCEWPQELTEALAASDDLVATESA